MENKISDDNTDSKITTNKTAKNLINKNEIILKHFIDKSKHMTAHSLLPDPFHEIYLKET